MKILVVAPYFGSGFGGVENYLEHLVSGLRAGGVHDVVVVTLVPGRVEQSVDRSDGLRVRSLPYRWKASNTPVDFGWARALRRILEEEAPDVVNAHMPVPGLADVVTRVAAGVPVVLTYHNDVVKEGPLRFVTTAYHLAIGRGTLAKASRIIVTSPTYARQSRRLRRHSHKLTYAPPGVDRTIFHPEVDGTPVHQRFAGERLVLFVGNLDRTHAHKGLRILLEAMSLVGTELAVRLVVVGSGDGLSGYRASAERLQVSQRVSFVGSVPNTELAVYYAASDVVVLPSTSAAEGFGMVLAEAQACGAPVIGSSVGGIPAAFVDGQSGFEVEPGSVSGLASRIAEVIGSPGERARLAKGAVRCSERFHWTRSVEATEAVFTQVHVRPVVHISTYFPPFLGGLERVVEQCACSTVAAGIPVSVLTSSAGVAPGLDDQWTECGVRVRRSRAIHVANLPILPTLFFSIVALKGRPILHAHYSQAGLIEVVVAAARLRRLPVVVHFHLDVRGSGRFARVFEWYRRNVLPATLRRADHVVVFSPSQAEEMERSQRLSPRRLHVVPNGVDLPQGAPRSRAGSQRTRIVFVGRLAPQKQVDTLLRALDGVSDRFDTRIIGDGELRSELERAAQDRELANVRFVGPLTPGAVRTELRGANLFVLPSAREGMPLALLEAMAEGAIVIASNVTGIKEIVEHRRNGLLFEAGDSDALRKLLLELASDPRAADRIRRAAYSTASGYTWQATTLALVAIYREISGLGPSVEQ